MREHASCFSWGARHMETLDSKLRLVIEQLATSARMSKLISINAALIAERLHHAAGADTSALKVVAGEIQRLSNESATGIATLHAVLAQTRQLTQTINLAGRQRMLSQKIMKLHLLQAGPHASPAQATELQSLIAGFEQAFGALRSSSLNTPEIDALLGGATEAWEQFRGALRASDLRPAIQLNEALLVQLHACVQGYESLAGGTAPAPTAAPVAPPSLASGMSANGKSPTIPVVNPPSPSIVLAKLECGLLS